MSLRKYLLKRDHVDLRDISFASSNFEKLEHLPSSVDLRPKMSPVVDQGQLGSCTANAIASGLREYLLLQSGQQLTRLSRLFLYWMERYREGTVDQDSGAKIRDGMKVLKQIGVCPESDYPYDVSKFEDLPTGKDFLDAKNFKINHYYRIRNLNTLKASLAEGLPVVIGIIVYESFESDHVAQTGMVPLPNKNTEQCLGGHAVCVVGYDDNKQHLIVRNSWGEDWGDKGYFYLPYSYANDSELVTDMWTGK